MSWVFIKFFKKLLILTPVSKYLSYWWNLGSLLGMLLVVQVSSGLLLTLYYTPETSLAFDSVQYIIREVNHGWLIKLIHMNGASFIMIVLYLHLMKGFFMSSYRLKSVWLSGLLLWYLMCATAFTGYALGWSQMAYWGVVVITSLISVIPYVGNTLLLWIWGGFSVCNATLKFFFVVHFLLPWIIFIMVVVHLLCLHEYGSSSILGYNGNLFKIPFWPYYWAKDSLNLIILMCMFIFMLEYPNLLGDPEMFVEANYLVSPIHIVPEWYFCAFYAILRTLPSKSLGVLFLVLSLLSLVFFTFLSNYMSPLTLLIRFLSYLVMFNFVMLSWLGQCLIEAPYTNLMWMSTTLYFVLLILMGVSFKASWVLFS